MAASASVQSIFSTHHVTRVRSQNRKDLITLPSVSLPRQQRNASMRVRCMAEEKQSEQPTPMTTASSSTTPPPQAQTPPPRPPPPPRPAAPKVSTKFEDVLAFSGPAPERINGRLAMIGFVAALAAEVASGNDVIAQLTHGGIPWFVGTTVVLSLASLIPLFKGVSVESRSDGVMTSNAELWNGRLAMLGLLALVFTEFVKGGALV
ncbi:Chlorophyll A-B binding protein [Macleaya cordata]|uniref:Chlorophyll A-B binding protein n=1 Tax=Macleaya cordata TaxID=56857 RepID=A0A200Q4J8_MACCD|nr:Chlorophyll A-B binding protein [Macleaya cordata]